MIDELRLKLLSNFLLFVQFFYPETHGGRKFELSQPVCRESHFVTVSRELTRAFLHQTQNIIINIPVRHGKSEMLTSYVAWCLAHYPDCQFIYSSVTKTLAVKQLAKIRSILRCQKYQELFPFSTINVRAKDTEAYFVTKGGGEVFGVGSGGDIIGSGAGLKSVNRFGGALIIDDLHKASEVLSDNIREKDCNWFKNDAQGRLNNKGTTPIIVLCQRLHEDDLAGRLLDTSLKGKSKFDGQYWERVIIPGLDASGYALWEEYYSADVMRREKETSPYYFHSQIQQNPTPAGGSLYKESWFVLREAPANISFTFVTVDTAETQETYNDASVFSHWGYYDMIDRNTEGLHVLQCDEVRLEPHELENEFVQFLYRCMRVRTELKITTPFVVAIEKKNVGVTLLSKLREFQGITLVEIQRGNNMSDAGTAYLSGNKMYRFITSQSFIASKRISLSPEDSHTRLFIDHMTKITANNTHAHDDIADTCSDAIYIAFIEKMVGMWIAPATQSRVIPGYQPSYKSW